MNAREIVWALAFLLFDREEGRPGRPVTLLLGMVIVVALAAALSGGLPSIDR